MAARIYIPAVKPEDLARWCILRQSLVFGSYGADCPVETIIPLLVEWELDACSSQSNQCIFFCSRKSVIQVRSAHHMTYTAAVDVSLWSRWSRHTIWRHSRCRRKSVVQVRSAHHMTYTADVDVSPGEVGTPYDVHSRCSRKSVVQVRSAHAMRLSRCLCITSGIVFNRNVCHRWDSNSQPLIDGWTWRAIAEPAPFCVWFHIVNFSEF